MVRAGSFFWGALAWGTLAVQATPLRYPPTPKVDQVDSYHGIRVADPYRWLEEADSAQTKAWVSAQNQVTDAYLDAIATRAPIKDRLTRLWNYEKYSVPFQEGGRYFLSRNLGLQNQSVLYTTSNLEEQPRVLLDPNQLSPDGTVALSGYAINSSGTLMAYGLSTAGSDWQEWKIRDIETGQDLPDRLKWIKFSGASWSKDGKGIFYSRYDEPKAAFQETNYFQKLYYHRIGTPQAEDVLIYERKDQKEWGFSGRVTDDGRYLILNVTEGTNPKNRVFYKDLQTPASPVVELLDKADAAYAFVDNVGSVFYFTTDRGAPRGQVIAIDTTQPKTLKMVIPEAQETLDSAHLVDNYILCTYLKDARAQVKVFDLKGGFTREMTLPGLGTVAGLGGKRTDKETFYAFTSFTSPATIYRYEVATGKSTALFQPKVAFNPDDFTTEQVFYTSKDGTRIPMFISYKKGLQRNSTNPTYLYGYGGFNLSLTPSFSPSNLVWMEMGGIYAVPNLRGGGEYGEGWHQAGTKLQKQNVFDDFIGAAEYLIAQKYTSTPKLAIGGGSNGGLLVGAAMTQRPDLFGAALPAVGVMDMLRFQKFTIGWAWVSDYGSSEDPEQFKALYAYSPLHRLKPGTSYPATLITTADHDDRVVPAHSFKFAATLQAAQAGDAPTLIRIETKAGHGAGKPTTKVLEEVADRWAFLTRVLSIKVTTQP
ncbi:prolyl oligopeptidase family serine peptidase [Anthocerotibacter panamensis]|uniref:prolyl oligopeptidase family serine peptidase n=1 Tax=Anthocerotibacter panamensis TaxID=2857077 RepID=UPI001C4079AB|nr:prolyl oligopeptidase family serine peptidase [Anthocerotibacter panamensis]